MNLTVTNELEDPDGEVAFRRTVTLSDVRLSQRQTFRPKTPDIMLLAPAQAAI